MALLVSVIVPVFNTERSLPRCIESILNQSYENLEVILVDDGSEDSCPRICDEYALTDSRVQIIHQENAGVSAARNTGICRASGAFVGFVDSDDWIEPQMYETLVSLLSSYDAGIAVCGYTTGSAARSAGLAEIGVMNSSEALRNFLMPNGFGGFLHNKLFVAELFRPTERLCLRLDETVSFCEDLLLLSQASQKVAAVAYINLQLYHYITRVSSATYAFSDKRLSELDVKKKIIDTSAPEIRAAAQASYSFSAAYLLFLIYRTKNPDKSTIARLRSEAGRYGRQVTKQKYPLKDCLRMVGIYLFPSGFCRIWNFIRFMTNRAE